MNLDTSFSSYIGRFFRDGTLFLWARACNVQPECKIISWCYSQSEALNRWSCLPGRSFPVNLLFTVEQISAKLTHGNRLYFLNTYMITIWNHQRIQNLRNGNRTHEFETILWTFVSIFHIATPSFRLISRWSLAWTACIYSAAGLREGRELLNERDWEDIKTKASE